MRALFLLLLSGPCWGATSVTIARPAIAKAGVSGSITLTVVVTGPAGTGLWTHVSGPGTATFGTPTATSTTYTAPTRSTTSADYVVQFAYTNSDGVTTAQAHVGTVLVDSIDVVVLPSGTATDIAINANLGPLTRWGSSPWPYFDLADRALIDSIVTAALANPPILGTSTSGTSAMTCTGFAYCTLLGTGTSYATQLVVGDAVIVTWDSVDGANTGRLMTSVRAIADGTHLTLESFTVQIDLPTAGRVYLFPATTATFNPFWWGYNAGAGSNSWNFYDVTLATYRLFYRTGVLSYLTQARQMADYWWQWAIDHGRTGLTARALATQSQYLRALDGKSERFPDLYALAAYNIAKWPAPSSLLGFAFDARESGYSTWFVALGAMADPNSGRHTSYCNALVANIPGWTTWQQPAGYWSEDLWSFGGYPYKPPGTSPWRTDIPIHGLQAAYDALYDTSTAGCNNRTLAATTLPTIAKAVEWTYNAGRSNPTLGGNGGVFYDAEFENIGQLPLTVTGTFSVALSSASVVGVGSSALSQLSCNGTRYIAFLNSLTVYRVASCLDNTHFTLTSAFGTQGEVANLVASTALGANIATSACPSTAAHCWDVAPPAGDRNLTRLMSGMTGWLYYHTGNLAYRIWGDAWFSNAFGGPAAGPGQGGACGGPGCDGVETDWKGALPSCAIDPTVYCNILENYAGGNVYFYLGKNHGQTSGAPGSPNYLAYRVMTPAPASLPIPSVVSGRVVTRNSVIR